MKHKVFEQIWNQLRAKKLSYKEFLEEINIKNLRGIKDLSVRFEFPVTVIAGPNASGKSTVLFACACAYKVPNSGNRDYVPTTLFPNLRTAQENTPNDTEQSTSFEFYYTNQGKRKSMKWAKGKSWNRSFMGERGGEQPTRYLYLRTLANLTSPSEVRSVLQIAKNEVNTHTITSDLLVLAQYILPIKYQEIKILSQGDKDLLFAIRENNSIQYSEFHMSAGERAILRISKDISELENALILIDEVEAGLHPFTQQQMMLELQRLALRKNLQIIVTSHSPVILESVPIEARVFLDRTENNVVVKPPYKDIFQKAFYGQSLEKLSILCEDDIGEAFLLGILDELNPKLGLTSDDIKVGRDTGKDQFAQHIVALAKFDQLDNFIFVLDGDAKSLDNQLKKTGSEYGKSLTPLYLPGIVPEEWAWSILKHNLSTYAQELGVSVQDLEGQIRQQDQIFDNATDKPTNIIKNKFFAFSERLRRSNVDLIRKIARKEIQKQSTEIKIFAEELELQLRRWQARN
ncbi:MAG: AAA family ATPase [Microscillaceae bacterium]|nr:AAA family ATPase [Microscillaceae bacterium]